MPGEVRPTNEIAARKFRRRQKWVPAMKLRRGFYACGVLRDWVRGVGLEVLRWRGVIWVVANGVLNLGSVSNDSGEITCSVQRVISCSV